ncbi:MAG: twin-arginine translocation signal domain-containing protein [Armatimonadia bacterium]|nr:twin-arginine translocation signal domain-containing protein [Armatimonadia bacterium]
MAPNDNSSITRRSFIQKAGVAAAAVGALGSYSGAWAQGNETLRAGLIGCGGRGTGAAHNFLDSSDDVEVIALADLFEDKAQGTRNNLKENKDVEISDDMIFSGFDCYEKILATDIDIILTASTPHFRPREFAAAVAAGKHVFMEKPLAVDPVGARSIMASAELADQKGLSVAVGTQRRHQQSYLECIQRVRDGAIGDIVAARAYWNGGPLGGWDRTDSPTSVEEQIRNRWVHFTWLGGDHIVEQHVHNIDVVNWFMGTHPVSAVGMGYRARKTYGDGYDFFSVDFVYDNGVHMESKCRQQPDTASNVSEWVVGTNGTANCWGELKSHSGDTIWRFRGDQTNPYVQEHTDLVDSIRNGEPFNDAHGVAASVMTAIMGRESAYTGQEITWDQMMESTFEMGPGEYHLPMDYDVRDVPKPGIYRI